MGSPEIKLIPDEFNFDVDAHVNTVSTADVNANAVITGNRDAPISLRLDPLDVTATLKGDPKAPVSAQAALDLDLRNLPHMTFEQVTQLVRTITLAKSRIRFPVDMNVSLSVFPLTLLGIDAISFSMCGEPAVIRDDCVPDCEEPCAEGDDTPRPVPGSHR